MLGGLSGLALGVLRVGWLCLDLGRFWRVLLGRGGGQFGVELCKELISGGLPLALAAPHHAAASVIADEREIAVALAPRDLIDRADRRDPAATCRCPSMPPRA